MKNAWAQGPIIDPITNKKVGERPRSLIKVFTDPGGYRVIAAADIWLKDPGKSEYQW